MSRTNKLLPPTSIRSHEIRSSSSSNRGLLTTSQMSIHDETSLTYRKYSKIKLYGMFALVACGPTCSKASATLIFPCICFFLLPSTKLRSTRPRHLQQPAQDQCAYTVLWSVFKSRLQTASEANVVDNPSPLSYDGEIASYMPVLTREALQEWLLALMPMCW